MWSNTSITLTTTGLTATNGTPAINYVIVNGDVANAATNEVTLGGAVAAADQMAPIVVIIDDESGVASIAGGDVVYTFTFLKQSEALSQEMSQSPEVPRNIHGSEWHHLYISSSTPASNSTANITVDVAGSVAIDAKFQQQRHSYSISTSG